MIMSTADLILILQIAVGGVVGYFIKAWLDSRSESSSATKRKNRTIEA
jgi:hypothetical protein